MQRVRSCILFFMTAVIFGCYLNLPRCTFGDDGDSIAELKSEDPSVIIENRQSKGRIKGELVSLTSSGVLIQIGKNPARNFFWNDYNLVYSEGLTNAHELLEHAETLLNDIDLYINNLKFAEGEAKSFEEITADREKALEITDRIKTQNIEKFPDTDVMPAFSTEDRESMVLVKSFKEKVYADYKLSTLRERFYQGKALQSKVSLLRKRLNTFNDLVSKKRYTDARTELNRQLSQIDELQFPPGNSDIESSLQKLNSHFDAILAVQDSTGKTTIDELPEIRDRWKKATEAFRAGMNTPVAGKGLRNVFQAQLQLAQVKVSELELLIENTVGIASLSIQVTSLLSYDFNNKEVPEKQQEQFETSRAQAVIEQNKWQALPPSETRAYALNELKKLDEKLKLVESSLQFVDFQKQGMELIQSLSKVRQPTEAREIAVKLDGLKKEMETLLRTPQVPNSQKQKLRKTINTFEEGRQRTFTTELALQQSELRQLQRTMQQVFNKKDVDISSAAQQISRSQAELPKTLTEIQEIGKLSPLLIVSVNKVGKELKEISSDLDKAAEVMQIRSSINEKLDEISTSENLDQLERDSQKLFDALAKVDISENKALDNLYQWTQSEVKELQSSIRSIRPVRSFQRESLELEKTLTALISNLPDQPLQDARISAQSTANNFSKLDDWFQEFPQLRVEKNRTQLLKLKGRQDTLENQIDHKIFEIRENNGWVSVPGHDDILLPPNEANKELAVISEFEHIAEQDPDEYKLSPQQKSEMSEALNSQISLRIAQSYESKGEFAKANSHYEELAESSDGNFTQLAARNGASRTQEALKRLEYESASQRRFILSVVVGVCLIILIGIVLYAQSKPVRLLRAKRHFEMAKRHPDQANRYIQLGSRLVSQYSYDDPAVQKLLMLFDTELQTKKSVQKSVSPVKLSVKSSINQSIWVCSALGTSEEAVRFVVDQLASEEVTMKKSERTKQLQWLIQQFHELGNGEPEASLWRIRELIRIVKLLPKVTDFRILLVKMQLANKNYSDAFRVISPLIKFESRTHKSSLQIAVQLGAEALVGLNDWEKLDQLVQDYEKKSKRPLSGKIKELAAIGSHLNRDKESPLAASKLHKSLDSLLIESPAS